LAFINVKHIRKALLALGIGLFFLQLYLDIARQQSEVNNDLTRSDQSLYMDIAKQAYESRFQYTATRNRMPLYPWLQALFYSPEMDDEAFFEQGKQFNVILSLACLWVLGIVFFRKFSKIYAFYAMLVIAFLVFAIKAPFFQTEILFYTLFGFAFILSLDTLISPKWYKSIGVGLLFALAHFSKASAMPGLFIFISSYGILLLLRLFNGKLEQKWIIKTVCYALAPLAVFMVLLFPYFQESKEKYGAYFYNINTSFYMWYDSWDEARHATKLVEEQGGWANLPTEELPSLSKYLEGHSLHEILRRFRDNIIELHAYSCAAVNRNWSYVYGYCAQVGLGLLVFALSLPMLLKGFQLQSSYKHWHIVWYVLLFFMLYVASLIWYTPIAKGPRTILSLMIPLLWITGFIIHSPQIQSLQLILFQRPIRVIYIVYGMMIITVFFEIYQLATYRAVLLYGGK